MTFTYCTNCTRISIKISLRHQYSIIPSTYRHHEHNNIIIHSWYFIHNCTLLHYSITLGKVCEDATRVRRRVCLQPAAAGRI